MKKNNLIIYIDGASKGNPGPSGIGVVICKDNETLKNVAVYIGTATNNIAEYSALITGLEECLKMKADSVKVNTDSQLLSRQINGEYKVKCGHIKTLYARARELMTAVGNVSVQHIPREENTFADKLANSAVKSAVKG